MLYGNVNGRWKKGRLGAVAAVWIWVAGRGDRVPALHKNYGRLCEFRETGAKFLCRGKFGI